MREKLIEILRKPIFPHELVDPIEAVADYLLDSGVTVQQWIPVSEQPNENGYYLCVIVFSAVGHKKEYRRRILFWEDNIWIEKPNSFRTEKPLYWMPMAEMPTPPEEGRI